MLRQVTPGLQPGSFPPGWQGSPSPGAKAAPIDLKSAQDFPSLGSAASHEDGGNGEAGFWERPSRPPKASAPEGTASATSRTPVGSGSRQKVEKPEESLQVRGAQLQELITQYSLAVEEPVRLMILQLSTSGDVSDYMESYLPNADTDIIRRFAEDFVRRGLAAPSKDSEGEAGKAKDSGGKDEPAKVGRKKRGKGKEVDPALLGFTVPPHRNA